MKANHNKAQQGRINALDVSDTSKILKWKQITTETDDSVVAVLMFPILQRY